MVAASFGVGPLSVDVHCKSCVWRLLPPAHTLCSFHPGSRTTRMELWCLGLPAKSGLRTMFSKDSGLVDARCVLRTIFLQDKMISCHHHHRCTWLFCCSMCNGSTVAPAARCGRAFAAGRPAVVADLPSAPARRMLMSRWNLDRVVRETLVGPCNGN